MVFNVCMALANFLVIVMLTYLLHEDLKCNDIQWVNKNLLYLAVSCISDVSLVCGSTYSSGSSVDSSCSCLIVGLVYLLLVFTVHLAI